MEKIMYYSETIKPETIELISNRKTISAFRVVISGDDYKACEESSKNMMTNHKTGEWGRGLINTDEDRQKAERVGRFGELSFGKIFCLGVDIKYKEQGDDYDFKIAEKTIDIKTSNYKPNYECGLIKSTCVRCSTYVFCFLEKEDKSSKTASVVIVGYAEAEDVISRKISPARMGRHFNYEIPYSELRPITKLLEWKKKIDNLIPIS